MFTYQLKLAWLALRRNPMLTALMVVAIGMGIGFAMTSLTVLYHLGNNPIPQKSAHLHAVQLDAWGPEAPWNDNGDAPDQLTYMDAAALMKRAPAERQTALYFTLLAVQSDNPEIAPARYGFRATQRHFFSMFDLKFRYGAAWGADADQSAARVAVLTAPMAEQLFGSVDPTGRKIRMGDEFFTVSGVVELFNPKPKFYDVSQGPLNEPDEAFLPFSTAIDKQLNTSGNNNCWKSPGEGWEGAIRSECIWIQYWAELPTAADQAKYLEFLNAYAQEQKLLGRFARTDNNHIPDVVEHLVLRQVVPNDSKTLVWVGFAFLAICLLNAVGLMLTKFLRRAPELAVRRALGASRKTLFMQHLVEAGVVGLAGGVVGVLLTLLGLQGIIALNPELREFVRLDISMLLTLIAVALSGALLAGIFPAWRASVLPPAQSLKTN